MSLLITTEEKNESKGQHCQGKYVLGPSWMRKQRKYIREKTRNWNQQGKNVLQIKIFYGPYKEP